MELMSYTRDLLKDEENKDDLPPIPEGWMAMHYTNANVTTTNYVEMGEIETRVASPRPCHIINHDFAPKICSNLEVLILVKEFVS